MMNAGGSKESRLKFLRRMIWWMPVLAFAIVAAVLVVIQAGLVTSITWGLLAAVIVAVAAAAVYFGYNRAV